MVVRLLSATEHVNVQVLYYQLCTLVYSSAACLLTYSQLVRPASARDVALLIAQGFFGYGNQARASAGPCGMRACCCLCVHCAPHAPARRITARHGPLRKRWRSQMLPVHLHSSVMNHGERGLRVQVCITKGLTYGRAASVMCMQYFSVVVSELAGMALFHEFTSPLGALGVALIIASMVAFVFWETWRKQALQGGASERRP
jgi:hypothetical protein